MRRVVELVENTQAEVVIVGLPLSLSGGDSDQTRQARAWAARLATLIRVPVELHDERFTTRLAQEMGGKASEDSRAAAVLLDGWLAVRANDSSQAP